MENIVTYEMILDAAEKLKGVARHTAMVPSHILSIPGERNVFFKAECLQFTGSFKLRGAYNRIVRLSEEEKKRGIVAASAGNHAQGVALAAHTLGIKATIAMPEATPLAKIVATKNHGAEVVLSGTVYDDAYKKAMDIVSETGAVFIHPFDDPYVIAGQGTIGLEIMEDNPDTDTIVVPIGGGGLAAGICIAVKEKYPHVKIIGVEAAGAACMKEAIEKGDITSLESARTMADGIAVKTPGKLTYDICSRYLDEIVTVEEDEIAHAMLTLIEKRKLMAEGAGAVALAAMLYEKFDTRGNIALVLSGGNVDITRLQRILNQGLAKAGRLVSLSVRMEDKPYELARFINLITENGGMVSALRQSYDNVYSGGREAKLDIVLQTNGFEHIEKIIAIAEEAGFIVEKK